MKETDKNTFLSEIACLRNVTASLVINVSVKKS